MYCLNFGKKFRTGLFFRSKQDKKSAFEALVTEFKKAFFSNMSSAEIVAKWEQTQSAQGGMTYGQLINTHRFVLFSKQKNEPTSRRTLVDSLKEIPIAKLGY